jgi:hypothetical protein
MFYRPARLPDTALEHFYGECFIEELASQERFVGYAERRARRAQ